MFRCSFRRVRDKVFGYPEADWLAYGDTHSRMPLSLDCKAFFGYSGENRRPIIYWTRGEKFVEELAGHIKESEVRVLLIDVFSQVFT
ncbi:unnamed protein product [Boreogadus saida]